MDLGKGLRDALKMISGRSVVDAAAVKEFLRQIQRVLISNDVPVKLVFELTKAVEKSVLADDVPKGLSVREHLVRQLYEQLCAMMGTAHTPRMERKKILLLGLFGSGKTTTTAKLAHFYKARGMSVAMVACDTDRPAAYEQLQTLAKQAGARFYGVKDAKDPAVILDAVLPQINEEIVIVDSAGRSGFDEGLVEQLKGISARFQPDEKILVISADIGQVAARQAEQFNAAVGLTGVILTKLDGSGKGGGALAACHQAKVPILFIGQGEKIDDFSPFDPQKFVGRLLGFADFSALLERINKVAEEEKLAEQDLEQINFQTFYTQMKAAKKMGPLSSVFSMMGINDLPSQVLEGGQKRMSMFEAIIESMTPAERRDVKLVRTRSRIERIAKGAGAKESDVRELISQFDKIDKLMGGAKRDRGMRKRLEKMMKGQNVDMDKLSKMI